MLTGDFASQEEPMEVFDVAVARVLPADVYALLFL
jgi:hypothetical protein